VTIRPWLFGLAALALIQAVGTLRAFAQATPRVDLPAIAPGVDGNAWVLLASSAIAAAGTVASVWINSRERAERLLREAAERELVDLAARMAAEVQEREAEVKVAEAEVRTITAERDQWMRRACSRGWRSSDDIPTRKDLP
jgi:hypothetical protein